MNKKFQFCLILTALFFVNIFAQEQGKSHGTLWLDTLPAEIRSFVLWCADHEENNMHDWEYDTADNSGGGIFNTGSADQAFVKISTTAFSGKYSAQTVIKNAYRSKNGARAVRLMRWTDKPWDVGGKEFPETAYYSTWMILPESYNPNKEAPWDPGDGGWWNIFQFKSDDKSGESQPVWVINIGFNKTEEKMFLYLYSDYNKPSSYKLEKKYLPVNQWFHLEAKLKKSDPMQKNGEIAVFLNGEELIHNKNIITCLTKDSVIWGIGNYTDHIDGGAEKGSATIYFDDAIISTKQVSAFLNSR